MYNSNAGDHHYTVSTNERDNLVSLGWNYEGIGWYSDDAQSVPLYRQYNPNATTGSHNYTTSKQENDYLAAIGWNAEGIGWYGIGDSGPSGSTQTTSTPHTGGGSSSGGSAVQECQHDWVPIIREGTRIRIGGNGGNLPEQYWTDRTFIISAEQADSTDLANSDMGMTAEDWYEGETYSYDTYDAWGDHIVGTIEPHEDPSGYVAILDCEIHQKDPNAFWHYRTSWRNIDYATGYKCSKCGATQ